MTMRKKSAFVAAAALALLAATGCAEEPKEPEALSATAAGGVYLDAVCPVNEAWGRVDVAVDRLRLAVARGEDVTHGEDGTRPLSEVMEELAEESERASKALDPTERSWPGASAEPVERVRAGLEADADQAREVAGLDAEEAAAYTWDSGEAAEAGAAAREALGLPEDADDACAQWEEQG